MATKTLKCKNCGATMEVDEDNNIAFCPYCGSKELIEDKDPAPVKMIKEIRSIPMGGYSEWICSNQENNDGTIRVEHDYLKRIDKQTTCPCANCGNMCSSYHALSSCKRRMQWVNTAFINLRKRNDG